MWETRRQLGKHQDFYFSSREKNQIKQIILSFLLSEKQKSILSLFMFLLWCFQAWVHSGLLVPCNHRGLHGGGCHSRLPPTAKGNAGSPTLHHGHWSRLCHGICFHSNSPGSFLPVAPSMSSLLKMSPFSHVRSTAYHMTVMIMTTVTWSILSTSLKGSVLDILSHLMLMEIWSDWWWLWFLFLQWRWESAVLGVSFLFFLLLTRFLVSRPSLITVDLDEANNNVTSIFKKQKWVNQSKTLSIQ